MSFGRGLAAACCLWWNPTYAWTPKVCRIIAVYRFWAISLPTVGGLGEPLNPVGSCVFHAQLPDGICTDDTDLRPWALDLFWCVCVKLKAEKT